MKIGSCPKCQSREIFRGFQSPLRAGEGLAHMEAVADNTGYNLLLEAYVCGSCGYVELYVADRSRDRLKVLARDPQNWKKVG